MKTYLIPEQEVENYRTSILVAKTSCIEETNIKIDLLGLQEIEVEEAKKVANIGDCLLFRYESDDGPKLMPFQVVDKYVTDSGENRCILMSFYLLEKRAFDQKTNVWRDCELRQYLNSEDGFLKKLDPELVKILKTHEVHTDDYVTEDKVWIPSHEEIGFVDTEKIFKPNVGAKTYKYYEQTGDSEAVA